jgi:hypothetical protein
LGRCREREGEGGEWGDVGVCPCCRTSQRRSRACRCRLRPATRRRAHPPLTRRAFTASRWSTYAARRRPPPQLHRTGTHQPPPPPERRIGVHPPERIEPRRRHRRLTSKRIRRLRCSPRVFHSEEPRSGRAKRRTVQIWLDRARHRFRFYQPASRYTGSFCVFGPVLSSPAHGPSYPPMAQV